MPDPFSDEDLPLAQRFRDFIQQPDFACVGAKAALSRGQLRILVARDIRSAWDDMRIYPELLDFIREYQRQRTLFRSFVVLFEGPDMLTEAEFEAHLWQRVQSFSDKDCWIGERHDDRVSSDPDSPQFSLSFGGEAFFVVGLHSGASRVSRRFERPALVFNLHDQFERLRAEGLYDKLRATIVRRDVALNGAPNPMLARFGEISEARQYSGRIVEPEWRCPFQRSHGRKEDAA
jgi:uncharacterized protein